MSDEVLLRIVIFVWITASHLGTGFTWWVWRDAKRELAAVISEKINSVAEVDTRTDVTTERIRLFFMQIPLDIIGWNALLQPSESDDPIDWFAVMLFMTFNFAVVCVSFITWKGRRRSLAILRKQARKEVN